MPRSDKKIATVTRRRARGFERAGQFPPTELGLCASRANELALARAWSDVAGDYIARRAPALQAKRGVLEIVLPEAGWLRALADVLPALAARVAQRCPTLGITHYRFVSPPLNGPAAPALPLPRATLALAPAAAAAAVEATAAPRRRRLGRAKRPAQGAAQSP